MFEVCAECPFIAACDVARELADNPNHTKSDWVTGAIDATEFALRGVVKRIGCDEPVRSQNGQSYCPSDSMAMFARGMGVMSWSNTPAHLDKYQGIHDVNSVPSNITSDIQEHDNGHGQYL